MKTLDWLKLLCLVAWELIIMLAVTSNENPHYHDPYDYR